MLPCSRRRIIALLTRLEKMIKLADKIANVQDVTDAPRSRRAGGLVAFR